MKINEILVGSTYLVSMAKGQPRVAVRVEKITKIGGRTGGKGMSVFHVVRLDNGEQMTLRTGLRFVAPYTAPEGNGTTGQTATTSPRPTSENQEVENRPDPMTAGSKKRGVTTTSAAGRNRTSGSTGTSEGKQSRRPTSPSANSTTPPSSPSDAPALPSTVKRGGGASRPATGPTRKPAAATATAAKGNEPPDCTCGSVSNHEPYCDYGIWEAAQSATEDEQGSDPTGNTPSAEPGAAPTSDTTLLEAGRLSGLKSVTRYVDVPPAASFESTWMSQIQRTLFIDEEENKDEVQAVTEALDDRPERKRMTPAESMDLIAKTGKTVVAGKTRETTGMLTSEKVNDILATAKAIVEHEGVENIAPEGLSVLDSQSSEGLGEILNDSRKTYDKDHATSPVTISGSGTSPQKSNLPGRTGGSLADRLASHGVLTPEAPRPRVGSTFNPNPGPEAHNVIIARAGTGKTTTLVAGLQILKGGLPTNARGERIYGSEQQQAIWDSISASRGARSIAFTSFNSSIAAELKRRVPAGCDAKTMHSMGLKAVRKNFNLFAGENGVDQYRVYNIIAELMGKDIREVRAESGVVLWATTQLVKLCKLNLVVLDPEDNVGLDACELGDDEDSILGNLADYYDISLVDEETGIDYREAVYPLVPRVLERCRDVAKDGCIDYDDMIWLPLVLSLPVWKNDLLIVDEAQDLNRAQQALARRAGKRLILCGDDKQAIYAFAGADSSSLPRMVTELQGCTSRRGCRTLPLTITYRCGKRIVEEARQLVPDFSAYEGNPDGEVSNATFPYNRYREPRPLPHYHSRVGREDMIISRTNGPLVSECFTFIRQGRRANIIGRDIGAGLIRLVNLSGADTVPELVGWLSDWVAKEIAKESSKKHPNESKIMAVTDKAECLVAVSENVESINDVRNRISAIFSDDGGTGIRLSSIHKAKGLESNQVFFVQGDVSPCPHPMAKTAWQREQELNLRYVAITRAIGSLVYVA